MSPASRRSELKSSLPTSMAQHQQGSTNNNSNVTSTSDNANNISNASNSNNNNTTINIGGGNIPSSARTALNSTLTGLVTKPPDRNPVHPSTAPNASFDSSLESNTSPAISSLPHPHHNPHHHLHPNRHPPHHHHIHDHSVHHHHPPASHSLPPPSGYHTHTHTHTGGRDQSLRQSQQTSQRQKITNKNRSSNSSQPNSSTNRQLHSQANRSSAHHLTANMQDSGTDEGNQALSSTNPNTFINPSRGQGPNLGTININPYWPEYCQPSQPSPLPLNYYSSPIQHQQYIRGATPVDSHMSSTLSPVVPSKAASPLAKPLNQNQVHAQTHPWRIKVYNACLACRKKKIKCDGLPTCSRCERLGFECSYIEVPQTPHNRNQKQKTKTTGLTAATSASVTAKTIDTKGSTATSHPSRSQSTAHQHEPRLPTQHDTQDVARDIRKQRHLSSIKDAASGLFLHQTTRRVKEPLPLARDLFADKSMPAVASLPQLVQKESSSQFAPRLPSSGLAADRDTMMPDLYHIFVNSVTIPNVARYSQSTLQANSSAIRFGGSVASTGVNQFNLALASPAIPTFAVLNADHTDPDQQHSSFQRDPAANSFLDQTTPLGFVITNKSVIQYLVHVYFECFHFHWMIVDKEKFLAQLKDPCSPPDPLLLVAICAAGAKYSDHEGLCAEPGNFATIGEQFLTHARILLQDRFDVPSMSTLQALLILYWCQVQTGRASLRFMYVGMAIRMAQVMGLNRPVDPKRLKDMDEREVQIRKTIWWSCYQADRWTSAALGKPMVISDVDCLVDYPASLSESERYYVESFHHMTDLAKILGKVILSLYTSTNAATCSSAVFSHLDQSLSEWFDSMPSISAPNEAENVLPTPTSLDSAGSTPSARSSTLQRGKPSTGSKSAIPTMKSPDTTTAASLAVPKPDSSSIGYYELLFHTVRIMLYRPFLHNSALTPILPLTLQSPQSQCRESAAAISEIAENMVTEQRSYRQLFNSIHISLCAAATVHRFVIISSKTSSSQSTGPEAEENLTSLGANIDVTPSPAPSTLSKAPSHAKTDLYYLTLLLRILQNCCRFSIEKNRLLSIIDAYLPHKYLSKQEINWARDEINKPFTIVPFSIKMPVQTTAGGKSMGLVYPVSQSTAAQLQQQSTMAISQPNQQQERQQGSTQQTQAQQHQQYQLYMRQQQQEQQQEQQQAKQQAQAQAQALAQAQTQARRLSAPTSGMASPVGDGSNFGTYALSSVDDLRQARSSSRLSSVSEPCGYATPITSDAFSRADTTDQQNQRHQHQLDWLQRQHRIQQSRLSHHHQQQTLQLEQAQLYQQQQQQQQQGHQQQQGQQQQQRQQQQQYVQHQLQQQQPDIFNHPQPQSQLVDAPDSSHQSPFHSRSRSSDTGMLSPQPSYFASPHPGIPRNKRQGEASSKKKQAKQRHGPHRLPDQSSQPDQQQHRAGQQQPQQPSSPLQYPYMEQDPYQQQPPVQEDSYMANANSSDVDPNLILKTLSGMTGSDEMMTNNSAPSVISHLTGTTDLSGTSLEEILVMDSADYTNAGAEYGNMDPSATPPLAGPTSTESQIQAHLTGSSNKSDRPWFAQHPQQPSATGSSSSSNPNNSQGRSNHSHRSSVENISGGSLHYILSQNSGGNNNDEDKGNNTVANSNNQARVPIGPAMMSPRSINVGTAWIGFDNMVQQQHGNNNNQLPPLQTMRPGENAVGYHYPPYTFSYVPQQPLHLGQPYVGYHSMGRSIAPYVYATDSQGAGMYFPAPNSQSAQGSHGFDPIGLSWPQHAQFAPPQQIMMSQQLMQQQPQGHLQQIYSSRVPSQVYPMQQQPGPTPGFHYIQTQTPMITQHSAQIAPQHIVTQQNIQQQQQQQQEQQQGSQQQQMQQQHRSSRSRQQEPQQQIQDHLMSQLQQQQKQHRSEEGVRPLVAPLPPLPQMMYRDNASGSSSGSGSGSGSGDSGGNGNSDNSNGKDNSNVSSSTLPGGAGNRPFSPASSNSTLVNSLGTKSNSDSSQQESSRDGSSGRETSSGIDSTDRSTSVPSESSSGQSSSDSARMSQSTTSPSGTTSNESSSNTESPNSTEDVSNSNESGSSSDNAAGSRPSSAEPAVPFSAIDPNYECGGDDNVGGDAQGTGGGGGTAGSGRRRRGKKSPSPSGSAGSSTSSSNATGSSSSNQANQPRHYRTRHQEQADGGGLSGGAGRRSPSSGSISSSGDGGEAGGKSEGDDTSNIHTSGGSRQSGSRRKHKSKYRSSTHDPASTASVGGSGGDTSPLTHHRRGGNGEQSGDSGGAGISGGGEIGDNGGGGGQHRSDSDSVGSGSASGSHLSGSSTLDKDSSVHQGGESSGGGGKNRSHRKGKGKGGKGKISGNPISSFEGQKQQHQRRAKRGQRKQQIPKTLQQ